MKPDDRYEAWRRAREEADPPEGFADRVMEGVGRIDRRERAFLVLLAAVGASRAGRVALLVLGIAACAARVTGTLSVLFTG